MAYIIVTLGGTLGSPLLNLLFVAGLAAFLGWNVDSKF